MKVAYNEKRRTAEALSDLADAIRSIYEPDIKLEFQKIYLGMKVGKCKNCGFDITLRQPWLSVMPVVNDGIYLVHCQNKQCHNYYGIEGTVEDLWLAKFVDWRKEFVSEKTETTSHEYKIINIFDVCGDARRKKHERI